METFVTIKPDALKHIITEVFEELCPTVWIHHKELEFSMVSCIIQETSFFDI